MPPLCAAATPEARAARRRGTARKARSWRIAATSISPPVSLVGLPAAGHDIGYRAWAPTSVKRICYFKTLPPVLDDASQFFAPRKTLSLRDEPLSFTIYARASGALYVYIYIAATRYIVSPRIGR